MTEDEILAHTPGVLSQVQRAFYFEHGYLHLEGLIGAEWLKRIQVTTAAVIEASRTLTESSDVFTLQTGDGTPLLRRLNYAADEYATYREFAFDSTLPDVVADLVGPHVKFRECMVNFKAAAGDDEVSWHQDLVFYPHTNASPLLTHTCLDAVTDEMGPLQVIPGSHRLGFFDHYAEDGSWAGRISDADLRRLPTDEAVSLTGGPGTTTILHGGTVHGSRRNRSDRMRALLVCGYSSADAFCYVPLAKASRIAWQMARGKPAERAHHERLRIRIPPDFSGEYTSIVELRARSAAAADDRGSRQIS